MFPACHLVRLVPPAVAGPHHPCPWQQFPKIKPQRAPRPPPLGQPLLPRCRTPEDPGAVLSARRLPGAGRGGGPANGGAWGAHRRPPEKGRRVGQGSKGDPGAVATGCGWRRRREREGCWWLWSPQMHCRSQRRGRETISQLATVSKLRAVAQGVWQEPRLDPSAGTGLRPTPTAAPSPPGLTLAVTAWDSLCLSGSWASTLCVLSFAERGSVRLCAASPASRAEPSTQWVLLGSCFRNGWLPSAGVSLFPAPGHFRVHL